MAWKVINNSEPEFKEDKFVGECPIHHKDAMITVFSTGRKMCETDLQKTYRESGRKCDLLIEVEGVSFAPCVGKCPLVTK